MTQKFFITHSWQDIDFAHRLCNDLRTYGLDGFFDAYSIQPGDDIASRIAQGLEDCDVYVPLLSPAAVASKWCDLEINTAINLSMDAGRNGRPRIIPVVVQPCKLPTLLRVKSHINFDGRYDVALKDLLIKGFGVTETNPKLGIGSAKITEIGTTMVFVPAGDFLMGSNDTDKDADDSEKPQRKIYIDAYWIDQTEVTNVQYKKCVDDGKVPSPWWNGLIPAREEQHPVSGVTWDDANAYVQWLNGKTGKKYRLPTEAEWEKAARGTDGRIYPWGNTFDQGLLNSSESDFRHTTPVATYPRGASPYSVLDMAGNLWEWVVAELQNPILKGGSYLDSYVSARCACRRGEFIRFEPRRRSQRYGLRVAETYIPYV